MPAAILVPLMLFAGSNAWGDGDPAMAQRDLEELRARLERLESELETQTRRRDAVVAELRSAEKAEAAARAALSAVRERLASSRQRLIRLEQAETRSRRRLSAELAVLERQLRAAYMAGRQEWLRIALSGEDPVETARQLVYLGYLSRARGELLAAVRDSLLELAEQSRVVAGERRRLAQLERERESRLESLERRRAERGAALAKLNARIEGREDRITELRAEAAALEALVTELRQAIENLPLDDSSPFAERKGRMNWPTEGRLLSRFGDTRADGRLRWEGTLLAAPAGSEVRAVHRGRVVFADWLPGLGLLAVLEHGDGYMSLYGHNRDLLKEVGDWVATGEVLAHVGDSGGRSGTGLYFEIRKDGRPIDPRSWIR